MSVGLVSLPTLAFAEEKVNFVQTALASTTLSGYVDTSAQWNIGTGNANVPNYAFSQGKADGFNLNVVKLTLEKPLDTSAQWAAGYKVDLLAGPDANFFGTQSSAPTAADFGVKQAYVALHTPVGNGLDFKIGVWDTLIGYEVFESINNPNVTRSYGWTMEPTTHTGIQANYQFCDSFSAAAGIANTMGPIINQKANPPRAESYKTYMGSFTFTAPTNWGALSGSTLTGCIINGFDSLSPAVAGPADQTSYYIGATVNTPVTGLKVGACYDYAGVSGQSTTGGASGYANAVGGYISYQATEKLSLYGRGEYASASTPVTFGSRKVVEATATVQYDLWKNVLTRVEFRWDHSADGVPAYGGEVAGEPTKDNSYILLANISYKF